MHIKMAKGSNWTFNFRSKSALDPNIFFYSDRNFFKKTISYWTFFKKIYNWVLKKIALNKKKLLRLTNKIDKYHLIVKFFKFLSLHTNFSIFNFFNLSKKFTKNFFINLKIFKILQLTNIHLKNKFINFNYYSKKFSLVNS